MHRFKRSIESNFPTPRIGPVHERALIGLQGSRCGKCGVGIEPQGSSILYLYPELKYWSHPFRKSVAVCPGCREEASNLAAHNHALTVTDFPYRAQPLDLQTLDYDVRLKTAGRGSIFDARRGLDPAAAAARLRSCRPLVQHNWNQMRVGRKKPVYTPL